MREEPVLFGGKTALVGIVSDPPGETSSDLPAVILLNAGGLHRVGPNRLYVNMARRLAALGFVVLRFDFSGFGDSEPRLDDMPFAKVAVTEVRSAMDFLTAARGSERFILIGICSGAEASFAVAQRDSRVTGAVLINGSGYDVASILNFNPRALPVLPRTIRFLFTAWPQILVRKMTRGTWGAKYTAELTLYLMRNLIAGQHRWQESDAGTLRTLAERGTKLLLVYEGGTPMTHYLQALLGTTEPGGGSNALIKVMKRADHTFNSVRQQEILLELICKWATHCGFTNSEQIYKSVAIGF